MPQGLKCQASLVGCKGNFACQPCSDNANGDANGPIVCYDCADKEQTKRWYAAKAVGKKHF